MAPKISVEQILSKLNELNLISNIDINNHKNLKDKLTFTCSIHNESWKSCISNVLNKKKMCSECRKTCIIEDESIILKNKNIEIISKINGVKSIFRCLINTEHVWEESKQQVLFRTNACYMCQGKLHNNISAKITKSQILERLNSLNYKLLNINDIHNTNDTGTFECDKHHIWETMLYNVYANKSGCPICSSPTSEFISIFILEILFNKKFSKTRKIVDGGLELDGYNDELKLAVEYNGIQHYIQHPKFFHKHNSLESQQDRDSAKLKYCKDNNIDLLVIPYTYKSFDEIKNFIINYLQNSSIIYHYNNDINWDEQKLIFMNNTKLDLILKKYQDYAQTHNGKCLSTIYSSYDEKILFKCDNNKHPEFYISPRHCTKNVWCNLCTGKIPIIHESRKDELNAILENANVNLISYGNTNNKLCEFECKTPLKHKMFIKWDNFKIRQYCNKCKTIKCNIPFYQYDMNDLYINKYADINDFKITNSNWNTESIKKCLFNNGKYSYNYKWSILEPVNNKLDTTKPLTAVENYIINILNL